MRKRQLWNKESSLFHKLSRSLKSLCKYRADDHVFCQPSRLNLPPQQRDIEAHILACLPVLLRIRSTMSLSWLIVNIAEKQKRTSSASARRPLFVIIFNVVNDVVGGFIGSDSGSGFLSIYILWRI